MRGFLSTLLDRKTGKRKIYSVTSVR